MLEGYQIIEAVVSSLAVLIIVPTLIITIREFGKNKVKCKCRSSVVTTYTIAGILYLFYNIFKLYTAIAPDSHINSPAMCHFYWESYYFYLSGKLFLYLFYSQRVYETFKSSFCALSASNFKILCISITIYYIAIILAFLTETAPLPYSVTTGSNLVDPHSIQMWSDCLRIEDIYVVSVHFVVKIVFLFVGETAFAVILLRLYVRKVLLVTNLSGNMPRIEVSMNSVRTVSRTEPSAQSQSRTNTHSQTDAAETSSGGGTELLFLQIAVKSTNLVIISLMTSILSAALFDAVGIWLLELDTLVNVLCMYLTFKFAKKPYEILCYGTHKCCWTVCVQHCFGCCVRDCCKCECLSTTQITNDERELQVVASE